MADQCLPKLPGFFPLIKSGRMQSRGSDDHGSGQPGASRGRRSHQGIDVVAAPQQEILSPIDGTITRECLPYADDHNMKGLYIKGSGNFAGWDVKLFYVQGVMSGPVRAGDVVGHAQDLTQKYPGITNHVHLEVFKAGKCVDPREPYAMSF